jgi:uncharacterized protein YbjQ (UPF0145 family)
MILSTTETIDSYRIKEYRGIVTGEAVKGLVFYKDFFASIKDAWGGRVKSYEKEILEGVKEATMMLVRRAEGANANAVIGVSYDIEVMSPRGKGTMILVLVSGTAVIVEPNNASTR